MLVATRAAPGKIEPAAIRSQHVRDRVQQGPQLRFAITGSLDRHRIQPKGDVVDEDPSVHLRQVHSTLAAVDEGVEGTDHVIAVHPKVEREVVSGAGRHARVREIVLRGDGRDNGLGSVAPGHRQGIRPARNRTPNELPEVRARLELDRLDPSGAGLAREPEPLRLASSGLWVVEEDRSLGSRRWGQQRLSPEGRARRGQSRHDSKPDQHRFRDVVAVGQQDEHRRSQRGQGHGKAHRPQSTSPKHAVPARHERNRHAAEHRQTAGELIDDDVEGQRERGESDNEGDGCRGTLSSHRSLPAPGYLLPMSTWVGRLADDDALVARLTRIVVWVIGLTALILLLDLLGVPVREWIRDLFHKIGELPTWAVVAGIVLQSVQTTLAAVAWLAILRAAFPQAKITFRLVLASYAVSVAMNSFLPANIGTLVMLIMFTTLIAAATFTAIFSGYLVQKIPFSIFNIAVYLYLFISVAGSFSIKLSGLANHKILTILIVAGFFALLFLTTRVFRRQWEKFREQLVVGGAILGSPRRAFNGLFLPELGSYAAKLGVIAVFLGAYSIPVTFHNVVSVTASNSISNTVSVTPGGVGVTQAMNTAALRNQTDSATATAYSASQQVITSAWNVVFATVLVSWVFGWSGGRKLVESSYEQAKAKSEELKEKRQARRTAEAEAE
jgi:uncharacterized membrane protein YbhN (UPF0104 family)